MADIFDKSILFAGISDEWLTLLDNKALDDVLNSDIKNDLNLITPNQSNIFEFARKTELDNIKIMIIGQDPYPKRYDAHGLAFSCLSGIPASLNNIYKCLLHNKLITNMPSEGNLEYWATQGVLLLNASLSTVIGQSNAHAYIWESYVNQLITDISDRAMANNKVLIVMLWGNFAKNKEQYITKAPNTHIMQWGHPSPLAQKYQSFIECPHFTNANTILHTATIATIDWNQARQISNIDQKLNMNDRKTIIFTDGSANPNKLCPESIAGYGVVFVKGVFADTILYGNLQNKPNYASNQRAEGIAILRALEYLYKNVLQWDECIIVTDSEFWINMIDKYMPYWIKTNVDFTYKKNHDITMPLWDLYASLSNEYNKNIEFRHIRSHNKSHWKNNPLDSYEYFCYTQNDYADQLARYARLNVDVGVDIIGQVDYE